MTIYKRSAETAPKDTLNPSLKPFDIDLLTDSNPEGPNGIEAVNPVTNPIHIALHIVHNENIVYSFNLSIYIIIK